MHWCIFCLAIVLYNPKTKVYTCTYCKRRFTVEQDGIYEILPIN